MDDEEPMENITESECIYPIKKKTHDGETRQITAQLSNKSSEKDLDDKIISFPDSSTVENRTYASLAEGKVSGNFSSADNRGMSNANKNYEATKPYEQLPETSGQCSEWIDVDNVNKFQKLVCSSRRVRNISSSSSASSNFDISDNSDLDLTTSRPENLECLLKSSIPRTIINPRAEEKLKFDITVGRRSNFESIEHFLRSIEGSSSFSFPCSVSSKPEMNKQLSRKKDIEEAYLSDTELASSRNYTYNPKIIHSAQLSSPLSSFNRMEIQIDDIFRAMQENNQSDSDSLDVNLSDSKDSSEDSENTAKRHKSYKKRLRPDVPVEDDQSINEGYFQMKNITDESEIGTTSSHMKYSSELRIRNDFTSLLRDTEDITPDLPPNMSLNKSLSLPELEAISPACVDDVHVDNSCKKYGKRKVIFSDGSTNKHK